MGTDITFMVLKSPSFFTEAIYETISSQKSETKVELPLIDIDTDDSNKTAKTEELEEEKNQVFKF
jgi:hypothetical protein